MGPADTQWLDGVDQARLVADGEVAPVELIDAAIARIEALDPPLNAVVVRWFEHARHLAEHERLTGPLAGVPFLLKDLYADYAGEPMTNGNRAMAAAMPLATHDTTLVARTRAAGLVTLGRTNSPEFGSVPVTEPAAHGPTRNPWALGRTPGGSSGGAAAAVAAGMVPIAHASDGGGSIRIPASCCGLVGLKPSQGRASMGPNRDESGLGVELCVTRTVRDTAVFLDAVAGPGIGDTVIAPPPARPYVDEVGVDPGRLRIGVLADHPQGGFVHDDCRNAALDVARTLEGLGHDVVPEWPAVLADDQMQRRFMAMWSTMMARAIESTGAAIGRPLTEDDVEPGNWKMAEYATRVSGVDYADSVAAVASFRRQLQRWWAAPDDGGEGFDLLLTPTLATPPLPIGELYSSADGPMAPQRKAGEFAAFTPAYNMSGQPAISLPLVWNSDGLPIGVQLVAAYGRDDLLIRVAAKLERVRPWADRRPPA